MTGGAAPIEIASRPAATFPLRTGTLHVEIHEDCGLIEGPLFEIATRRNPKRSFLFVSTVLGRHIPVSPKRMRQAHVALASRLPADIAGPVLFVGMAETAIALGAGVHREFVLTTGRGDCLFLPSTRHPAGTPLLCRFKEEHSHATDHLIHIPDAEAKRALLAGARSLVLVDDEMTTGRTFDNVAAALREALPSIRSVHRVVITDWSGRRDGPTVSLASGSWRFEADPDALPEESVHVDVTAKGEAPIVAPDWGRLGNDRADPLPAVRPLPGRTLVLGSGEYVWPAYLHALALEQSSAEAFPGSLVHTSATTRSPVHVGGAIRSMLAFQDNYGLAIPNFLYNVRRPDYDRIILFSETPASAVCETLVAALAPTIVVPGEAP